MLRSRWWAIAGVLALALIFAACGGGDDEDDAAQTTTGGAGTQAAGQATQAAGTQAAANIKRGGTLNVALSNNPRTFDPMLSNDVASSAIVSNVFEGLYKYDEQLRPVPWLAEKVDVNADSTVWTFTMRKGVKFHDGTEMNAEAVKFSMDRIRNNQSSVGYADARTITDVTVVDPSTVRVTLSEPFAPFPSRLTGRLGAVISPTAVKSMGDEKFGLSPVGTGPFKFGEWRNDVSVTVTKFEGYWKQGADGKALPYLDRVEWRIITEAASRLTALQSGDVDVSELRELDLPIAKKDANIQILEGPGFGWGGLWLTINKPPFDNKSLRLAVSYALDRDEINQAIYENSRTVAYGPIPPTLSWAVDPNFKPFSTKADPDKAKQMLTQGGRPTGFEFEYWISAGDQTAQQLAELMQAQLAKVGIKMNIQAADFNGVVIPKLMKQESNGYQLGLTGGVDPDQHVAGAYAKGGSFNFFPYENPQVDELIKKGRAVSNMEERAKIYKDAVKLIMEDSPYIYTFYNVNRFISRKNVQGGYVGSKATTGYAEFWKQ
jgi:ABC-type transport system substrate-binding protein